MDAAELYELWMANNDRPVWVRKNREAINEHTDLSEPVPDASNAEMQRYLDRYKGTITRQLNDTVEGTDPEDAESDLADADEIGD